MGRTHAALDASWRATVERGRQTVKVVPSCGLEWTSMVPSKLPDDGVGKPRQQRRAERAAWRECATQIAFDQRFGVGKGCVGGGHIAFAGIELCHHGCAIRVARLG